MKYRKYLLVAAALVVIGATSIKPTMAYFTDSHQAAGTVTVQLGDLEITPKEDAENWEKNITVNNTGDYEVFVRVKAICGSQYKVTFKSGEGWKYRDDGYYYYDKMLAPEGSSSVLTLTIEPPKGFEYDTFNVVIIQEASKAKNVRDESGTITGQKATWDELITQKDVFNAKFYDDTKKATKSTSEGGNE